MRLFKGTNKDPLVQVISLKWSPWDLSGLIYLWIFIVWVTPWKVRLLICLLPKHVNLFMHPL